MTNEFTHPFVRDLYWVMNSPSLLSPAPVVVSDDDCRSLIETNRGWLQQLDTQPEPLMDWLKQARSTPLGYYFEQLVAFWLRERIAPGRVEYNVRVYRDKRVLGEYDFLFQPAAGDRIEHWETAVKFYLCYRDRHGNYHWIGPNPVDTLDLKLSRLMDHQLKLNEFPEARVALRELAQAPFHIGNDIDVRSRAFVKGYLFYPSTGHWLEPSVIHHAVAAGHLKGWWTRIDDPIIPGGDSAGRYTVLPRLQWLAPKIVLADHPVAQQLLDKRQLLAMSHDHFKRFHRPLLVAVLEQDPDGRWRERSRGFVVDRIWPGVPEKAQ